MPPSVASPTARASPTAPAYVVRVQGLPWDIHAEQLQQQAAAAFGDVLTAEVDPSESDTPTRTGTVAFASQDAAVRAAAHWQGACELGEAITAQLVAPPGPQQQQQEPQPPPQQPTLLPPQTSSAPQQQQQPPRQQQAAQQPPWPQQQEKADVPPQHAPRSPLRRRPAPKPAIVVRGLLPTTTAETLYAAFGSAGHIRRLRLVTDAEGHSAGVAFITFQTAEAVRRALQRGEGIVIDGARPTVGPAHREADPEEQAQQAQQAAGESQQPVAPEQRVQQPQQQPARHQQQAQQQVQHAQQAPSLAGPSQLQAPRRGSFSGLPAGGTGWEVHLQRAGSSPALSGLGGGPPSATGSLGTLSSSAGEASSTDTLFARPLAPEVDESALREFIGEHAGVLSIRILRLPDGTSRGCGFVRFAEHSQARLVLQALNGAQLFGRTLRLSWAHQRQPQHSPSPSLETISRPRSFGASSSGDFSPTAPRLSAGAAIGMVPMLAASPGYPAAPIMMSPVYWQAGGMYAAPAVPAMPPGSPIPGSPIPGSPVIGSPYQFAQPMAGFAALPPMALAPPALPLDAASPVQQGWAVQQQQVQQQWPPHWQPMPQAAAGGGSGVPWPPPASLQFGQQPAAPSWQWQAQQPGAPSFFWDGTTVPRGAAPAAARSPAVAPAPQAVGSPSSGGEASVGSAVGAVRTSASSAEEGPSPRQWQGQQASEGRPSSSPPGSPTPDERSGDLGTALRSSSGGTSAQPSSSHLLAPEAEEQPAGLQDAAAAEGTAAADDEVEAAAGGIERLCIG
ncbi:hypothetical protein COHA_000038 [Chlorella ohadii]|uniref:RRM domain-containing protein n=1 Tax=Chlorella ohadii TaxID=2649997 RepID=A0AAD5H9S2_9CHLO|nr:hypothetical protein COHA_000038 [Chlorella ohadii]